MSCKPEDHYILLGDRHRIEVVLDSEGVQRYIPQAWTIWAVMMDGKREIGYWVPILPEGESRQMLRDARNDCAINAGKEVLV